MERIPDLEIKPGSPPLQADSLPSEPFRDYSIHFFLNLLLIYTNLIPVRYGNCSNIAPFPPSIFMLLLLFFNLLQTQCYVMFCIILLEEAEKIFKNAFLVF